MYAVKTYKAGENPFPASKLSNKWEPLHINGIAVNFLIIEILFFFFCHLQAAICFLSGTIGVSCCCSSLFLPQKRNVPCITPNTFVGISQIPHWNGQLPPKQLLSQQQQLQITIVLPFIQAKVTLQDTACALSSLFFHIFRARGSLLSGIQKFSRFFNFLNSFSCKYSIRLNKKVQA